MRPLGAAALDYFPRAGQAPHAPGVGQLLRIEPGGEAEVVADDLVVPNGVVLSADGRRLILAETFANRLTVFDVGPDGALTNRRLFADLGEFTKLDPKECTSAEAAALTKRGSPIATHSRPATPDASS